MHTHIPKGEKKHIIFSESHKQQLKVKVVESRGITHKINGKFLCSMLSKKTDHSAISPWVEGSTKTYDVKIPECMQGYLIDKGRWLNPSAILGNETIKLASSGSGNVFGNSGLYIVGD